MISVWHLEPQTGTWILLTRVASTLWREVGPTPVEVEEIQRLGWCRGSETIAPTSTPNSIVQVVCFQQPWHTQAEA